MVASNSNCSCGRKLFGSCNGKESTVASSLARRQRWQAPEGKRIKLFNAISRNRHPHQYYWRGLAGRGGPHCWWSCSSTCTLLAAFYTYSVRIHVDLRLFYLYGIAAVSAINSPCSWCIVRLQLQPTPHIKVQFMNLDVHSSQRPLNIP